MTVSVFCPPLDSCNQKESQEEVCQQHREAEGGPDGRGCCGTDQDIQWERHFSLFFSWAAPLEMEPGPAARHCSVCTKAIAIPVGNRLSPGVTASHNGCPTEAEGHFQHMGKAGKPLRPNCCPYHSLGAKCLLCSQPPGLSAIAPLQHSLQPLAADVANSR